MRPLLSLLALLIASVAVADNPILLITPKGVYIAEVENGVPGEFKPFAGDVILRGFGSPPTPKPDDPGSPVPDSPEVLRIATISKTILKDADEATKVYSVVDAIRGATSSNKEFSDRLSDLAGLIDAQMKAEGRVTRWIDQIISIVPEGGLKPPDVLSGLKKAFSINLVTAAVIAAEASQPVGSQIHEKAVDFIKLIELIRLIIEIISNWNK